MWTGSCGDPTGRYSFASESNHNHDLKEVFKGAALVAVSKPGPFREFCLARSITWAGE
jgi:hypothetical protein